MQFPLDESLPAGGVARSERARGASANRLRLSIVDVTFALFCLIPPLVFGGQLLNSDGDAARHIRMGELMLSRGLFTTDSFSFTRPDEPIMLTEWGSRLLYAVAHGAAGLAGVALLAGLLIGTSVALVVLFLRARGVDPLLAYLTGIVVALVGQVHWLARPHLFTLVGLALLLFVIEPGSRRRLWPIAPLFVIWANLHGGFILGLIILLVCAAAAFAEAWLHRDPTARAEWRGLARGYAVGFLIATAASMFNPQGPMLHVHIAALLGDTTMTSVTFEFMSPNFHTFYGKLFLLVLGVTFAVLAVVPQRPTLPRLAVILLLFAGALVARRNIPLFGLVALPLLALHAQTAWNAFDPRLLRNMRTAFLVGEAAARPGRWIPAVLIVVLALGAVKDRAAAGLLPDRFDPEIFPVAAVEHARAEGITGRMFNMFGWGGYVIYAWPDQKIFIDGMTDYFGSEILDDYRAIIRLESGWVERMQRWDIDLALLATGSQLAYQLRREPGWTVDYEDDVAVLLRRTGEWATPARLE